MSEQGITNDELARMIKDGFDAIGKQVGVLESDVSTLKSDVVKGFEKVGERLDRIELMAFGDYKRRIERLEDQVKGLIAAR